MPDQPSYEPQEWQDEVNGLLVASYPIGDYVKVPDAHLGDFGIEGFTRDGKAFQCYAPEEPITTKVRYERCRDKMRDDLAKFRENSTELRKLFGTTVIERWILATPIADSARLLTYAGPLAEEVRAASLPYVHPKFEIAVADDSYFDPIRDRLKASGVLELELDAPAVTPSAVQDWVDSNEALAKRLKEKLSKISISGADASLRSLIEAVFQRYLHGRNLLENLRVQYPNLYERLKSRRTNKEATLEARCRLQASGSPSELLSHVLEEYRVELRQAVGSLATSDAELLAWEAAADWLMRCPLDFYEPVLK